MPAAAVIPAPIVDIKIVAVEKLVVEILGSVAILGLTQVILVGELSILWNPRCSFVRMTCHSVTESKLECSKQAIQL